jgi:hypothetical protein
MIRVRPMEHGDRPWVVRRLEEAFGDVTVARKGALIDAAVLSGCGYEDGRQPVGLLTYDAAVPVDHELEFELPLGGSVRFDRDSP